MAKSTSYYSKGPSSKLSKKYRLKWPYWVVIGTAAIMFAGYFWHHSSSSPQSLPTAPTKQSSTNYQPATKQEQAVSENIKDSPPPTSTPSNTPATYTVSITNASVTASNNAHIGTQVNGTSAGKCTLTASQAGQADIVRTSSVRQDINVYSCGVFNIPVSSFPHDGKWTITLKVAEGSAVASDNSSVNIP